MMRSNVMLGAAAAAAIIVLAGCTRDSGAVKSDSAAADSIRDAHDAAVADSAAAANAPPADSVRAPVNSTEGTIGETRKVRMHTPDTAGRDSAIQGPYKTMDSLGRIKR